MRRFAALFFLFLALPAFSFAQTPNDELYVEQWYLDQINAPDAWDIETGDDDIIVAVLDAGVDLDHPDLIGNMWKNTGEIAGNGNDDDGNGFVDDVDGWDFVDADNDPSPDVGPGADESAVSHGSLVAGIIGAEGNNEEGITGVAWSVTLMPVRMLDDIGSGSSFDARRAIDYAVANGADIINLSFTGSTTDNLLAQAVRAAYEAGVVIVAAVGNENLSTSTFPVYPACYTDTGDDWVIGVASVNQFDEKSEFSNYGDCVDLSAPGEDILGVNYYDPAAGYDVAYDGFWSGTSMSAPVVSGAAALLLSAYPDLTPMEVNTVLQLSVDPLASSSEERDGMGAGRINLSRAFEVAEQISGSQVEEDPLQSGEPLTGSVLNVSGNATVYYIPEAGARRAFINATTYFTYYDSFEEVEEVTDISGYALEGLMLPRPGVVLVKIQSIPTVYALEENPDDPFSPLLRAISSEEVARDMYGEQWADFVIDIEPTFFSKFTSGPDITSPIEVDTSIMKTRQELAELAAG